MNRNRIWVGAAIVLLAIPCAKASEPISSSGNRKLFTIWGKVNRPMPGPAEPIGTYAAGCLAGAKKLALDGTGYSVMRPSRKRYFGHTSLVTYIQDLAKKLHKQHLPLLLVGDMGRPRGGPMISGHASHQIGLDVDLWYRMSKKRPNAKQRENWSATSFVKKQTELSPAWNDSYRKLMAAAAQSDYVNRIFVHPVIKRDLCAKFKDAPWLYKVRAWWAHHDHLHVRLHCPEGSASCEPQAALDPSNNQCGKELDWWFSEEAAEEGQKKSAAFAERDFPKLPEKCDRMVSELQTETKK